LEQKSPLPNVESVLRTTSGPSSSNLKTLESISARQELLSKFCQSHPWLSRGQPNQYVTVLYPPTTELFCLNPKTGSTSLKTLVHMKFKNRTEPIPKEMTSGKGYKLMFRKYFRENFLFASKNARAQSLNFDF